MVLAKDMTYKLMSGNTMHMVGLGTFQMHGRGLIKEVLDIALSLGYRSFDTAHVYGNEVDIGISFKELLPKYKLTREDIRITTKLPPGHPSEKVLDAVKESLRKLNCGYIDLYLIHWPGQSGRRSGTSPNQSRLAVWTELVKALRSGLVKDIGVSNFTVPHLVEILKHPDGVKPAVNQVEWHPYCREAALKKLCRQEGILLQAYSSLGGSNNPDLLSDPDVQGIAKQLNKGAAQVLLRWALQQNIAVIPKARSRSHLEANISLDFEIPDNLMEVLNNLQSKKQQKYAWDPRTVQ